MLEKAEMTKDVLVETVPSTDPEEAVDAEFAKIPREKQLVSDGFDDVGSVDGRTSNDGDLEERVEV
jgi:hypothetical protein